MAGRRTREEGEVAIKGPMVMKGYYKNSEATAQVIKEGWFLAVTLDTLITTDMFS